MYQWHGITHRIPTLAWLKQLALKLKMLERYNEVKILEESSENFYGSSQGSEFLSPNSNCGTPINGISPFSPSLSPTSSSGGPSPSPIERKTSLGVACQKFLMLFLIAPEVRIIKEQIEILKKGKIPTVRIVTVAIARILIISRRSKKGM